MREVECYIELDSAPCLDAIPDRYAPGGVRDVEGTTFGGAFIVTPDGSRVELTDAQIAALPEVANARRMMEENGDE